MRIHLLDGMSRYDVFRTWMWHLRQALNALGHEAIPTKPAPRLEGPDPVVSLGFSLVRCWSPQNRDQYHIAWTVDHPAYLADLFMPQVSGLPVNPDRTLVLSVDRGWARFASRVYGFPGVTFVAHPGPAIVGGDDDWRKRPVPVLVCGSVEDPDAIVTAMRTALPPLRQVAEGLLTHRFGADGSLDDAVWRAVRTRCQDRFSAAVAFNALYPYIDRYHRNRVRVNWLKALKKTPVVCCGAGPWSHMGLSANVEIRAGVDYAALSRLMRQAKVMVNCTPTLGDGSHERIFEALAAGCVVVSTPSVYLAGEELPAVRFADACGGDVESVVSDILADDTMPENIAASQRLVMERHSMRSRAEAVLAAVSARWPELGGASGIPCRPEAVSCRG